MCFVSSTNRSLEIIVRDSNFPLSSSLILLIFKLVFFLLFVPLISTVLNICFHLFQFFIRLFQFTLFLLIFLFPYL